MRPLRNALDAFRQQDMHEEDETIGWLWLAPVAHQVVHELWDDEMWHEFAGRSVQLARETGALTDAARRSSLGLLGCIYTQVNSARRQR